MTEEIAAAEHDELGEGHSPAAWTAVTIMLVAITAGTVFFWLDMPLLVWICAALVAVGALVGWGLAKAGWGVKGPRYQPKGH